MTAAALHLATGVKRSIDVGYMRVGKGWLITYVGAR